MERVARWGLAALVLAWVAAPAWPEIVDDVYISAAYAHEWVSSGRLRWTTDEVVEGYSNFLMVAAMAVMVLLDLDVGLWSQVLAMACGMGVLALLSALLPRGAGGTVGLLAVAAWAPLAWWSAQGMETTLYALLLSLAWVAALRGGAAAGWAVPMAALASTTRPEGAAHLLAVLLLGLRAGGSPWALPAPTVAGLLGLLGYHVLRVQHFGELWPTSALVKVAGVPWSGHGLAQLGGDLVAVAGPALAVAATRSGPRDRRAWLALAPLALQALVLVRASGDWMTWGRLTMPGALASLASLAVVLSPARGTPGRLALGTAGALAGLLLVPAGYGRFNLDLRLPPTGSRVRAAYTQGLYTPVADDVVFAAWHLAEGASLMAVDAGILGNLHDVRFIDMRGLTHRPAAEAIAQGQGDAWFFDQVSQAQPGPDWLRVARWDAPGAPELPEGLLTRHALVGSLAYPSGGGTWWYSQTPARADAALAATRLRALSLRFPSQPHLAREAAVALAAAGRLEEGTEIARAAARRWPQQALLAAAPESLFFVGGSAPRTWQEGRGFGLFWNAELWSRPLTAPERAQAVVHLDQDAAGTAPARARLSLLGACEVTAELDVAGPTTVALADLGCADEEGPGELRVAFLNDEAVNGADRNLYVWVDTPTTVEDR